MGAKAFDKAKHYKAMVAQLEEEVKTPWDANEGMKITCLCKSVP